MDMSQLAFIAVGAVAYAILQALHAQPPAKAKKLGAETTDDSGHRESQKNFYRNVRNMPQAKRQADPAATTPWRQHGPSKAAHASAEPPPVKPDEYRQSSYPVLAPKFSSNTFDSEVNELVSQLHPRVDENQALQRLVAHVKHVIQAIYPDADVNGFVHSSILRGTAFGVAVPEVDLVAYVCPETLMRRASALLIASRHDWRSWEPFLILALAGGMGWGQVHSLNLGLQAGEALVVVPIYYSMGMLFQLLMGAVYFHELIEFASIHQLVCFWGGVAMLVVSIFAMTKSRIAGEIRDVSHAEILVASTKAKTTSTFGTFRESFA